MDGERYLRAMGIPLWRRRLGPDSSLSVAAPADASPAAAPEPVTGEQPDPPLSDPRAAAIAGLDWDGLLTEVRGCRACPLHASRTQAVFGVGRRDADWMIIGEAPGADEDRLGEPFVGRAGKLLDLMLAAMGLARDEVYIANILKSRPPNNRDPAAAEMRACWPFLARQIELVAPKIIVAMGRIAAQSLLDSSATVGKLRGRLHNYTGPGSPPGGIPLLVTYHPAYLLRSPREKRKSWADLQLAMRSVAADYDAAVEQ